MPPIGYAKFTYGDSSRLFINTELGCASACTYCYLPSEGLPVGARSTETERITARELLTGLINDERVKFGASGTIFSIGCFSECWDKRNKKETISLILGLLPWGNRIQMATKRKIYEAELFDLTRSPHWKGQLSIYISSATISGWAKVERGTQPPHKRFESFVSCKNAGVAAFLYIKPVIPGMTINDIEIYAEIMKQHCVSAIVGDHFYSSGDGSKSPISKNLQIVVHQDTATMRNRLSAAGRVFSNSTDSINN